MRDHWIAITNYAILAEVNSSSSLKATVMKLKLIYFGHVLQKQKTSEKILIHERTEAN